MFFKDLIREGSALVYVDDILLMSFSKWHMLQLIEHLQNIANKKNLNLAAEKSCFLLLTVKCVGLEIDYNTIKPFESKNAAFHKIYSPTTEIGLMKLIGSMSFYAKFFG